MVNVMASSMIRFISPSILLLGMVTYHRWFTDPRSTKFLEGNRQDKPTVLMNEAITNDVLVTFIVPSTLQRETLNRTLLSLQRQTNADHWRAIVGVDLVTLDGIGAKQKERLSLGTPEQVLERSRHFIQNDPRISYTSVRTATKFRGRKRNGSGSVRNEIIQGSTGPSAALNDTHSIHNNAVNDSDEEWIAFVDDDDTLSPFYVEYLRDMLLSQPSSEPAVDVVLFRMQADGMNDTIPTSHMQLNMDKFASRIPTESNGTATSNNAATVDTYWLGIGGIGISFAVRRSLLVESNVWFQPHPSEDFFFLKKAHDAQAKIRLSTCNFYNIRRAPVDDDSEEDGNSLLTRPVCSLEANPIIISEQNPGVSET